MRSSCKRFCGPVPTIYKLATASLLLCSVPIAMASLARNVDQGGCEFFVGNLTTVSAEVLAEIRLPAELLKNEPPVIQGGVDGPHSPRSRTLASRSPWQIRRSDVETDAAGTRQWVVLASALIPDPCFWNVEVPFSYQATVKVELPGGTKFECSEQVGLRPLGTSGRRLTWAGKNWVVRGVDPRLVSDFTMSDVSLQRDFGGLESWSESHTALILGTSADQELAAVASAWGTLVIQVAEQSRIDLWSRFPGVAMALIAGHEDRGVELRRQAPNVLLGQFLADPSASIAPWAHLLVIDADNVQLVQRSQEFKLPMLAARRCESFASVSAARHACDQLQADMAAHHFAGYLLLAPQMLRENQT